MKDELEDFVRKNRQAFDDKEPSPKVWKRIETSLALSPRSWTNAVVLWRAAAIFFMTLSLYLLIPKEPMRAENALAMKEFTDVEAFYVQQITNKVELIGEFKENDGLNGFTHDFQQLEAMYLVLKEEMKTRPSSKVKDALVLNLLVQIDLLNQHLHRLEKEVKPQHENEKKSERKT
jgi:hypothetical protein